MSKRERALQEWAGQSETFVFNIVKACDDALVRIARLEAALRQLRQGHRIVEDDPWFSCPLATYEDGHTAYVDGGRGHTTCDCGADAANAIIAAALQEATDGA